MVHQVDLHKAKGCEFLHIEQQATKELQNFKMRILGKKIDQV